MDDLYSLAPEVETSLSRRDPADDGPEAFPGGLAGLCRFFAAFPDGANATCLRSGETPVTKFMEIMSNAKRPH